MPDPSDRSKLGRYYTAGLQFIIPFAGFALAGVFVDRHLKSLPGFTIQGAILGFVLGMWRLRQLAKSYRKEQEQEQPLANEQSGDKPKPREES